MANSGQLNLLGEGIINSTEWVRIQSPFENEDSLIQIQYTGNHILASTHGFLRAYYPLDDVYQGEWKLLFPKQEREFFFFPKINGIKSNTRYLEFRQRPHLVKGTRYTAQSDELWGIRAFQTPSTQEGTLGQILSKLETIEGKLVALELSQRTIYQMVLSNTDFPTDEPAIVLPGGVTLSPQQIQILAINAASELGYHTL